MFKLLFMKEKKKYKSEVIQRVITPNRDEIENEVYRALKAYVPFKNVEDLMAFWQCFIKDIENLLGEALQKHVWIVLTLVPFQNVYTKQQSSSF